MKKRSVELHAKGLCGCLKSVWMLKKDCTSRSKINNLQIARILKLHAQNENSLSWNRQRPDKRSRKGPCICLLFPEVGEHLVGLNMVLLYIDYNGWSGESLRRRLKSVLQMTDQMKSTERFCKQNQLRFKIGHMWEKKENWPVSCWI